MVARLMVECQLRPAHDGDADALSSVHLSSRAAAEMPPGIHTDAEVRSWLGGRLAGSDEIWLAEVDDRVVGFARFTESWLDDLYVVPSHARQGIGSALLDLVMSLRPRGFSLWVFESNRSARAFYAAHGLVRLERTDGSGNEERAPDIRLAWPGSDPMAYFRSLIDEVDDQLGDLLARRAALTRAVQGYKSDTARDPARERQIARTLAERAPELGVDRLARIVDVIITESLGAASDATVGEP